MMMEHKGRAMTQHLKMLWGVYNGNLRFYGYNDYQDKIITDFAPQQKYDLSISGATDKSSYYVSFGFLKKTVT
jgi:hypothetical protein